MCKVAAPGVGGLMGAVGACGIVDRVVAQMAVTGGQCDSVTVQWVPSHVGVQGNERADAGVAKGARRAFRAVLQYREVRDIWNDLGLEEMDEYSEDNLSGGSHDGAASDSDSEYAAEDLDSETL